MSAPQTTSQRVEVTEVGAEAAEEVTRLIHAGFRDRPALDPPASALDETVESVAAALGAGGGLVATFAGSPTGALLLAPDGPWLGLRRVSVAPAGQGRGVAKALAVAAEAVAARRGHTRMRLTARVELPPTVALWTALGYREISRDGPLLTLAKETEVRCAADDAEATRALGRRLAGLLRPGDLVILTGDLGAGKTTFTQGVGEGLGVRGAVTSPTFVLSRVHPSLTGGPPLVHVDAYRLGAALELDDLDLDVSLDSAVTVVEWGEGLAERLADDRLVVGVRRATGTEQGEQRAITLAAVGARWVGSELHGVVA